MLGLVIANGGIVKIYNSRTEKRASERFRFCGIMEFSVQETYSDDIK